VLVRVGLSGQMRSALDTAGNVDSATRLAQPAMCRGALRQRFRSRSAILLCPMRFHCAFSPPCSVPKPSSPPMISGIHNSA